MWANLAVGLLARPWARRLAAIALVALSIALFILNLRRKRCRPHREPLAPHPRRAKVDMDEA